MGEWDAEATQIRAFAFVGADRVLVADADLFRRTWLRNVCGTSFGLEEVDNVRAALERLTGDPPKILVVGTDLADVSGGVLLAHAARYGLVGQHRGGPVVFLISDTPETAPQVDEHQVPIFYRLTPNLQPERARELLNQALARGSAPARPTGIPNEEDAARVHKILEHSKRLGAQPDIKSAATAAIAATIDVTRADRARCLYYDDDSGTLWSESDDGTDEAQASDGIAGYVVRAQSAVVLPRAGDDPAYRPHVDDPAGTGEERILVQPVTDGDGRIHAVLIAIRDASQPPFGELEQATLRRLSEAWAPYIHTLALEAETHSALNHDRENGDMFRQEAIAHMIRHGHSGDVVRIHGAWVSSAYWVVLAAMVATFAFAALAEVHQYVEGAAVVRVTGRDDLIAYDGGSVTAIEVAAGQEVTAGQVLLRLHDTEQAGRMRGLEAEFERKLVAYLQTPADPGVRQALGALVSERESALANLEARVIRAPHPGIVKDMMVRNGQRVDPGAVVVSLSRKDVPEGLSVIAFLPGGERPRLRANQRLRLTLPGYRGAHLETGLHAISAEVLGATEAKMRFLGERLGDSVPIQGTVVVVEARLSSATFESDGEEYELHDGMVGRAEVQLESRSVLSAVFPGLEE